MLVNSLSMRPYRGAHIHIINYFQRFVVVVFYRGHFYQFLSETTKQGEYTNEEYLLVLDAIRKDAEKYVDAIKKKRSFRYRLKSFFSHASKKRPRRISGYVPQESRKER